MAGQKGLLDKAQDKATAVAKKGAKEVRSVASEALSAAAAAAAAAAGGVVLDRMAGALQKGKEKVEEAKPTGQMAAEPNVAPKKGHGQKEQARSQKENPNPVQKEIHLESEGRKKIEVEGQQKAKSKKKSRRR